jgi:hypothetical protein
MRTRPAPVTAWLQCLGFLFGMCRQYRHSNKGVGISLLGLLAGEHTRQDSAQSGIDDTVETL